MKSRDLKRYLKIAQQVDQLSAKFVAMTDQELKMQTNLFREQLQRGVTLEKILVPAYATIREADSRVLGMRPFFNQVVGAVALFYKNVAEMKTGEGKTLTATLPMYLHGLSGPGNYLITANAYLADRDAKSIGVVYEWLGLTVSVGTMLDEKDNTERDKAAIYDADIVYTTNSTLGFDYLFDNLAASPKEQAIRGFNFALIDEIDAVLLDMAQTPLVISGAPRVQSNLYALANAMVKKLNIEEHIVQSNDQKKVWLTNVGIEQAEALFGIKGLLTPHWQSLYRHILLALRANYLFKINRDYVVENGEIVLLDNINGRKIGGTKLQAGLHQALEAKEHILITNESRAMASITYQNLFRKFKKLAGMTGTGMTDRQEFLDTYGLNVIAIPTNKPVQRIDRPDLVYVDNKAKILASVEEVKNAHAIGRPVLIATGSVTMSNLYSHVLLNEEIPHSVLNASSVARESAIIAEAGKRGAVTVTTSMAGRGTDIKLAPGVKELGGLLVIGTERMANKRIDAQLRGRAGRQGDPGESVFYVSLTDKVVIENIPKRAHRFQKRVAKKVQRKKLQKFLPLKKRNLKRIVARAQNVKKISEMEARFQTLQYDEILKLQRNKLYDTRNKIMISDNLAKIIDEALAKMLNNFLRQNNLDVKNCTDFIYNHLSYDYKMTDDDLTVFRTGKTKAKKALIEQIAKRYVNTKKKLLADQGQQLYYERVVILKALDTMWIEQVDHLQQLKTVVNGRNWAQRNPLYEYQNEAYQSFKQMQNSIMQMIISNLCLSKLIKQKDGTIDIEFP